MLHLLDKNIKSNFVDIGTGLKVHYLECNYTNKKDAPIALLLHGFPEISFSWRKILPLLSKEGFRAIAIDQRGYGETIGGSKKYEDDIREYNLINLVSDLVYFLKEMNINKIDLLVGHDAGSIVAGVATLLRPDLFKSLVMMSAPFTGPSKSELSKNKIDIHCQLKGLNPPRKHYQWYFSTKKANDDMHLSTKEKLAYFLRSYFHVKSADWEYNNPFELTSWTGNELEKLPEYYIMKLEATMVESVTKFFPKNTNCDWLNDDELNVYTNTFFKNGFQSALNWYRCMTSENQNIELNVFQGNLINNFTLYISGEKDWGMYQKPGALNEMKNLCKNFKGLKIIKNAGHWVQQEKPEDVAKTILNFYSSFA